jgi:hypothetical protein
MTGRFEELQREVKEQGMEALPISFAMDLLRYLAEVNPQQFYEALGIVATKALAELRPEDCAETEG